MRGLVLFWERRLHPVVYLVAWLVLLVCSPWFSGYALALGVVLCVFTGEQARKQWWRLLQRTKILLLTLAVFVAYSVPGVLVGGHGWAPSQEGMVLAGEQILRLSLMLGALALLLTRLSKEKLMLAMWSLLRLWMPSSWANRSVARLALALRYIEDAPEKIGWRSFLGETALPPEESMRLPSSPWRHRDVVVIFLLVGLPLLVRWFAR